MTQVFSIIAGLRAGLREHSEQARGAMSGYALAHSDTPPQNG